MKKIILPLILILFAGNALSQTYKLTGERLAVNLQGVCHNDKIVLAYGGGGIVMTSTDKGSNWEQHKVLDDSLLLREVEPYGDVFFGICYSDFIFKLDEDARLVKAAYLPQHSNLIDFEIYDGSIYLLTNLGKIEIFNNSLEKEGSIDIDTSYHPTGMVIFNDHIIISSSVGKIFSLDMNNDYKPAEYNVMNYGHYIKDMRVLKDKLYLVIGDSALYYTSDPENGINKLASHVKNFYGDENGIYSLMLPTTLHANIYWPALYKLDSNNEFNQVSKDSATRYCHISLGGYEFVDDNTIIAVGSYKTIIVSTNGGSDWELKSNLYIYDLNVSTSIWLDRNRAYYNIGSRVFSTTNAGVTWLPQLLTDKTIGYADYFDHLYMDETGTGFAISLHNYNNQDSNKVIDFIYTRDFGNTFTKKWQPEFIHRYSQNQINVIKKDSFYLVSFCPVITKNNYPNKTNVTYFYYLDTNFNIISSSVLDGVLIIAMKQTGDNQLTAYGWERSEIDMDGTYPIDNKWIMHSDDFGRTWVKDYQIDIYGIHLQRPLWYNNDLFIGSSFEYLKYNPHANYTALYHLNMANRKNHLIFQDTTMFLGYLFNYDGKVFINDHEGNVFSSSRYGMDDPQWQPVEMNINKSIYISDKLWSEDSVLYLSTYELNGPMRNHNFYKFTAEMIDVGVDDNNPLQPDMYTSLPYPLPARDEVGFYHYFGNEGSNDATVIKVCNSLGGEIAAPGDIYRIPINAGKEKITWNCSSVRSGVYFIVIESAGKRFSVPVTVVK